MQKALSKCGVPIASFVLALLLAWLAGPARNAQSLRAAAEPSGSCSVEITGPGLICQEDRAEYKAKGMPEGGTYEWSISTSDGASKIEFAKGPDCTVKVTQPAKSFTLHVLYRFNSERFCTANKPVTINDVLVIPICAKRLRDSTGTKGTKMTDADIVKTIEKTNEIWKKCCIRFELVRNPDGSPKIDEVKTPKKDDGLASSIEVRIVEKKGVSPGFRKVLNMDHHDNCINVYFVKEMTNVQGLTTPPGYPPNPAAGPTGLDNAGTAVDDAADPSTLAHELGHELGLKHKGNASNLMNGSGANGETIDDDQCAEAYKNAKRLLAAFNAP